MTFEYDGRKWDVSPTTNDTNSLFHAAFGHREANGDYYIDDIASVRRMNWQNFLSYYESRPRPTFLRATLQELFKKHGWSVENDDAFREYVRYAGENRQVLLGELPVIASLENTRIVLFEDQNSPKIIEPLTEALGDYPLANIRPVKTAVVVFRDSVYSKLTPQYRSVGEEEKGAPPKSFRKAPISFLGGLWYEMNLLSIVMLNALKKYDHWRLSTEDSRAGYFDDLVLEFGPDNSAFLLQAKWKSRKGRVHLRDLFSSNRKNSDFALAKYFFAYQKVKDNFKINSVTLCTNTGIKFDELEDCVNSRCLSEDDLLYFEDNGSLCHTFKDKILPVLLQEFNNYEGVRDQQHLITEENVKNFLGDFRIVSLYPRGKSLEQAIEDKIVDMGLSERHDGLDYARHLNSKIIEWHDEIRGEYLTPLPAKIIFCGLRSDKLLAKLRRLQLSLKPDRLHVATTRRISHVVPQNDYTLSLLKVSKFLANEESKTLFLSTSESAQNQKMMAEAFESEQYSYLVIYKSTQSRNVQELCDVITRVLSAFGHKKVIMIADRQDELAGLLKARNGSIFEAIDDNVTFTDLTESSQEQLLEKAILFYEASL